MSKQPKRPQKPNINQPESVFLANVRRTVEQETDIPFERVLALRKQAVEEADERADKLSARELGYLAALHRHHQAFWDDPAQC